MGTDDIDLLTWLRKTCGAYRFDVAGIFRQRGDHPWPLVAASEVELEEALSRGGHLLPLPQEPAALANVLEVSIVDHVIDAATQDAGIEIQRGTERGYPDFEVSGRALGGVPHAVDVKVARRASTRDRSRTQSRITLYTGNTYFKWPQLHWPGTFRPFADYASHLDIIVLYTLVPESTARVQDLELVVQPAWSIASTKRSSTTREYIGAVDLIEDLRRGQGEFASQEEFYKFWRAFPFKVSAQVQNQFKRIVEHQQAELDVLRAAHPDEAPS